MRLKKIKSDDHFLHLTFLHEFLSKGCKVSFWENGKEEELDYTREKDGLCIHLRKKDKVRNGVLRIFEEEQLLYRKRFFLGKQNESVWDTWVSFDNSYYGKDFADYSDEWWNKG
ncbi:MAG: hypothetical protein Q4C49_05335 [Bacillota bacterium]|nr:hypothetical protein [Bacillota bacterium]